MKVVIAALVLAVCCLYIAEAAHCPCSVSGTCYYDRPNMKRSASPTIFRRPSNNTVRGDYEDCADCEMTVSILQEVLQDDCCDNYGCDQECMCDDLESFCSTTFKYFPALLEECFDDVFSITDVEFKLLGDPDMTPEQFCEFEEVCE